MGALRVALALDDEAVRMPQRVCGAAADAIVKVPIPSLESNWLEEEGREREM